MVYYTQVHNRWINRLIICIIQLCFSNNFMLSQTPWKVEGHLIDSLGVPIEMAVVYANSSIDSSFISFTNSNEKGDFSLLIPFNNSKIILNINRLGYKPIKYLITLDTLINHLIFELSPQLNSIKEVIVKAERARIVEQGDTTTYRLKEFRDSTEYSIEDLLKKLPGIEVNEEGKIKANGKDIKTVLVEGADMFGRQYTIGTKNIRAIAIEQVDVIRRYEDNPVLKGIKQSDDVVLNIKLSPDKKNIINGNFDIGLGTGLDAAKEAAHLNIFDITKKFKSILLSDNGNATQTLNARELSATYDDLLNEDDSKSAIRLNPELTSPPSITNPSVSKDFIENSLNTFSTIRNIFNPNERLKIGLNATFAYNKDHQQSNQYQSYLYDSSRYIVDILQQLQIAKRVFDIEGNIHYTNSNQKTNFQLTTKCYGLRNNVNQNTDNKLQILQNVFLNEHFNVIMNGLFSQKISTSSVLQIQIKTQLAQSLETTKLQNENFNIFSLNDSLLQLNQKVGNPYKGLLINGRYIKNFGKLVTQFETEWIKSYNSFNKNELYTPLLYKITDYGQPVSQTLNTNTFSNKVFLNYYFQPSTALKVNIEHKNKHIINNNISNDSYSLTAVKANVFFEIEKMSFGRIAFGYNWSQYIPTEIYFLTIPYFKDAFSKYTPFIRNKNNFRQSLFANYTYRNALKNRFFNANMSMGFNQNLWRESFIFNSSIQEISSFYSHGNQNLSINSNFSQFIPSLKTGFEIKGAYAFSKSIFDIQNIKNPIFSKSYSINPTIRIALKYFLRLNISNDFNLIISQNQVSKNSNRFINNRLSSEIFYNLEKWKFSFSINHTTSSDNSQNTANLVTSNLSLGRKIISNNKESTLRLQMYNLNFVKNYNTIFNDNIIFFKYSVEAVRPFFILKYDFSF